MAGAGPRARCRCLWENAVSIPEHRIAETDLRAIIHVDMDAFYASVEQHDNPQLRGRPVMVGGGGPRGVVAAASYEARQFGVRSAMPGRVARRLCPHGMFVKARFARYREVSEQIFAIFHRHADQVEGLSLDEAYLDVSSAVASGSELESIGRALKREIGSICGLTASVGMAHNKLLAKLASDYDKPDGFVLVRPEDTRRFLDPLPVRRIPGIGPRSAERLHDAGIYTVGQLRRTAPALLEELFGRHGIDLARRAAGLDDRPVKAERIRRSFSQETTFDQDHTTLGALEAVLLEQAEDLAATLARKQLFARTVTVKLRSSGFSTLTRSRSLDGHTCQSEVIAGVGLELLRSWAEWRSGFAVRLIGLGVSTLAGLGEVERIIHTLDTG
ncbi:MAG: DNA polymerase IV [Wenzhouxiangella sp.]|nr:DNA polymerase IV [Wenzhouxiangella sp.]